MINILKCLTGAFRQWILSLERFVILEANLRFLVLEIIKLFKMFPFLPKTFGKLKFHDFINEKVYQNEVC